MQMKAGNTDLVHDLLELKQLVNELRTADGLPEIAATAGEDSVITIAAGQRAIYRHEDGCQEVEVVGHRYTPRGLMIQLLSKNPGATWMVAAQHIEPIHGITQMVRLNLITGQTESLIQEGTG
jgi:hypothetical protein